MAFQKQICPMCESENLEIVGSRIENIQYKVTDDFFMGTRVTKIKKKKIVKADEIKAYKCNDCGNIFELKFTFKLK